MVPRAKADVVGVVIEPPLPEYSEAPPYIDCVVEISGVPIAVKLCPITSVKEVLPLVPSMCSSSTSLAKSKSALAGPVPPLTAARPAVRPTALLPAPITTL